MLEMLHSYCYCCCYYCICSKHWASLTVVCTGMSLKE